MRIILTFLIFIFYTTNIFSQQCDCNQYYNWLKKTFEENDAGFKHTIENKGKETYDFHNKLILEKVTKTTDIKECTKILKQWLTFFRKFHIGLVINSSETDSENSLSELKFTTKSEKELKKLTQQIEIKPETSLEGIWHSEPYTILINKENESFVGYIINSKNENWKNGAVKFSVGQNLDKGIYIMGDHSSKNISTIVFSDSKYLVLDGIMLEKQIPIIKLSKEKELYYKTKFSEKPFITKINEETVFLKLPSFGLDQQAEIDNLLSEWKNEILKSKNLLIDIRNNGGGADKTYNSVLPFVYTNPIHRNQIEFYSSEQNNKKWSEILNIPKLPEEDRTLISDFVKRLNNNIGGFERLFKDNISVIKLDTIFPNPQHVAVIINENTASAAEQFILDLKQSWKVKVFGHQTTGALDIANVTTINSSDNKLMLVYSTSRFVTINKVKIDDVGILPDFYINDEVEDDKWINFILEQIKK